MISTQKSYSPLAHQVINSEITTQKPLKTENKVWGAILSFFGQAIKVKQADGEINYVKISELKEKFVFSHLHGISKAEAKIARKDKVINDLFLSTINPLKGTTVSKETLDKFSQKVFESGLNYSSTDPKPLYATLRKIRASIYTKDGMTSDQKKFIGNIQVGDIIFHRTDDSVHSDIVQFQKVANSIGLGPKHRDGVHHNHVYMCAKIDEYGKKWFAEAAWPSGKLDEIRLISEDDIERCFIKQDHGAISELFRCANPELAKKAAEEACKVTTKLEPQEKGSVEKQPTKLRYSIVDGTKALFHSTAFKHGAKARLFQWIRSTKDGGMSENYIQPNSFFCSSLIGYAYQVAEARPIIAKLVKEKHNSGRGHLGNLCRANQLASRHKKILDRKMQFKLDTKHSTPADLYSWISQHKELFTSMQSYQQPNNGQV